MDIGTSRADSPQTALQINEYHALLQIKLYQINFSRISQHQRNSQASSYLSLVDKGICHRYGHPSSWIHPEQNSGQIMYYLIPKRSPTSLFSLYNSSISLHLSTLVNAFVSSNLCLIRCMYSRMRKQSPIWSVDLLAPR